MTTKIVSQLDENGYFVGLVEADESPLEPGVFLIPRGSVDVEPPSVPYGKRALWSGDAWVMEDAPADQVPEPDLDDDDYTGRDPEYIIAHTTQSVQKRLDDFAKTRNYDGILSAATYATSTVPKFASEGQYAVEARDATWAALYAMMEAVEAGQRPMPANYAEVEAVLPALEWPNT